MPYSEFREAFEQAITEEIEKFGLDTRKLLKDSRDTSACPFTLFITEVSDQYELFRIGEEIWFYIYYNTGKPQSEITKSDTDAAAIVTLNTSGEISLTFFSYPNRNGKSRRHRPRKTKIDKYSNPLLDPCRFVYPLYMQVTRYTVEPTSIAEVDFSKDQNLQYAYAMFGEVDVTCFKMDEYDKDKPEMLSLKEILALDEDDVLDIFYDVCPFDPDEEEPEEEPDSEIEVADRGKPNSSPEIEK